MLKVDVLPVYALTRGTIAEIESVVKDFFRESISDETLIIKFSTGLASSVLVSTNLPRTLVNIVRIYTANGTLLSVLYLYKPCLKIPFCHRYPLWNRFGSSTRHQIG